MWIFKIIKIKSSDTKRTLMHLFLFTKSAQGELVSICTQSIPEYKKIKRIQHFKIKNNNIFLIVVNLPIVNWAFNFLVKESFTTSSSFTNIFKWEIIFFFYFSMSRDEMLVLESQLCKERKVKEDMKKMTKVGWPKCTDCTDFLFCNPKIVRIVRIFFQVVRIVRIFILEIHRFF